MAKAASAFADIWVRQDVAWLGDHRDEAEQCRRVRAGLGWQTAELRAAIDGESDFGRAMFAPATEAEIEARDRIWRRCAIEGDL